MSDMKTCSKCKEEKPKEEFSRCAYSKDGLQYSCKRCGSIRAGQWQKENPDRTKQRNKAWYSLNVEKVSKKNKDYYESNKELRKVYNKKWKSENKERNAEHSRAWAAANPKKAAAITAEWRKNNPEKSAELGRRRRIRKLGSKVGHSAEDVYAIFESQSGLCANCSTKLIKHGPGRFHVDHIMPLSKGGSDDKYNLQCLCPTCNLKKHSKDPLDWAKENWKLI